MKNRFGLARCCCENFCEDCCNGNAPTEWDVEILLTDGQCDTCDEYLGGVFTLARSGPEICNWSFWRNEPSWTQDCETDYLRYGYIAYNQPMDLEVRCVNETQYQVTFTLRIETRYNTGVEYDDNGDPRQTRFFKGSIYAKYQTLIDYDDFICDEQTDFEIPFVSAFMTAQFAWLYEVIIPPFPPFRQWLTTLESRLFTTVPIGQQTFVIDGGLSGAPSWNWVTYPVCDLPSVVKVTAIP